MNFEEYFGKFEKMQRWMINDLRNSSIKAQANFLVAMGVFNYIEILGSFCLPNDNNADRFNYVFKNLLSESYLDFFNDLQKITKSAYGCLRCGMTHEYLVKTYNIENEEIVIDFTVYGIDSIAEYFQCIKSKDCGLKLINFDSNNYHIRIYNPNLIQDLNLAFEKYKKYLFEDKEGYRDNFIQRCEDIRLEKFN